MRTFTVVPSFDGESTYFELPDIGFQGDHLSFAILFNLTELTEHWPNILPSMIVTDPQGNTYIAPHTSWNADKHIFTWVISSTETTYDGYLMCQLKCISSDDPETIVCMSRICQTRVYKSLEAASDPPEAFQTWIDTLVELGAEINADASAILESVETTQTNARTAQSAAEDAAIHKNAAQQARNQAEQTAQIAVSAQERATQAQQKAQNAANSAESAKNAAEAAQAASETALEEVDLQASAAATSARSAADSATQAETSMVNARKAQSAAEDARDAAKDARDIAEGFSDEAGRYSETALAANSAAEKARDAAIAAKGDAETARDAAQTISNATVSAKQAAEGARDSAENYSEISKKWAVGLDKNDSPVASGDQTYNNNSKYWADRSSDASDVSVSAKNAILNLNVSTVFYSEEDASITFAIGGSAVANASNQGGVGNG